MLLLGDLSRNKQIGAVFIDYIQEIPLNSHFHQPARYLEIKKVSEFLLNSAKTWDIPTIVGAQLGREASQTGELMLHSLRESGDLEQDAKRHTAINNWRLQGNDYFRIMAASGHKTMEVFKRYNSVSKAELKRLVEEKPLPLDTNMDTKGFRRGRGLG